MGVYQLLKWLFSTSPRKCLLPQGGRFSLFTCDTTEYASGKTELCCYDAETDNHYCCPVPEPPDMPYTTRLTGTISAAVILLILLILICIFSSKCPLKKAYLYQRSRAVAKRMTAAEETPGV